MVKRVLMVAYHFPPVRANSGLHRTMAFARYLPAFGWEPLVLTVHPRAYIQRSNDGLADIPRNLVVRRAFAIDTGRHLAIAGHYSRTMALPDRWVSWWLGAIPSGLQLIKRYRPQVIWSTFPIATAHLIGLTLQRRSGLPWVADFRDPMAQEDYPRDPLAYRTFEWIEQRTISHCARAVFTAPGAVEMYARRYPNRPEKTWTLIENGYEDHAFDSIEAPPTSDRAPSPVVLVHSGLVYPSERDPRAFFDALADLRDEGEVTVDDLRVVFRASGSETYLQELLRERGIENLVRLEPRVAHREALREILSADGLLVLQASNCNHQVPAKVYEYLKAKRPILVLADPSGDTARVMRRAGISEIAPLDSKAAIVGALKKFLLQIRTGEARIVPDDEIARHSRRFRTGELATVLDAVSQSSRKAGVERKSRDLAGDYK